MTASFHMMDRKWRIIKWLGWCHGLFFFFYTYYRMCGFNNEWRSIGLTERTVNQQDKQQKYVRNNIASKYTNLKIPNGNAVAKTEKIQYTTIKSKNLCAILVMESHTGFINVTMDQNDKCFRILCFFCLKSSPNNFHTNSAEVVVGKCIWNILFNLVWIIHVVFLQI